MTYGKYMKKTSKNLRIGILGTAGIAPAAIVDPSKIIPAVDVTAIASRDHENARKFAKHHGVKHTFGSYSDLINSDLVDFIYIPLPISEHAKWAINAANSGKHVLVEKSFAMNVTEAKAMIKAGTSNHVRMVEAFHHRYHPLFEMCLNWVSTGRVGRIMNIDAEFSIEIPINNSDIRHIPDLGGGALRDLGCYPISWVLSVCNEMPKSIDAVGSFNDCGVDEVVKAQLYFPSGLRANVRTSMATGQKLTRSLVIAGDKDTIIFNNPLAPHDGADLYLESNPSEKTTIPHHTTYYYQLEALRQAIQNGTKLPTEGENILRQQSVLDKIHSLI